MRLSITAVPIALACLANTSVQGQSPSFETVQVIFEDNCIMCHNGPKAPKGLRLDSFDGIMKGSDRGPVVKAGDHVNSELIRRVRGVSTPRMPLSGPPWLDESDIQVLEQWIAIGAPGPVAAEHVQNTNQRIPDHVTYAEVESIFKTHCVKCHNHRGLVGPPPEGLRLGTYQDVIGGTDRVYVVPGNPDASELVRKIRGLSLPRMPFDGPPFLTEQEIRLIELWIVQGNRDERGQKAEIPAGQKVRLRGTLKGEWLLDDLQLVRSSRTKVTEFSTIGSYVEVRGRVTADGGIAVDRIRSR